MSDEKKSKTYRRVGAKLDEWKFAPAEASSTDDARPMSLDQSAEHFSLLAKYLSKDSGHTEIFAGAATELFGAGIEAAKVLDDRAVAEYIFHCVTMAVDCIVSEAVRADVHRELKSIKDGSKGGKAPKRRLWAECMAKILAEETACASDDDAWAFLAGCTIPFTVEVGADEYEVYIDGSSIVAANTLTRKESPLAKSSFLKEYYRPARSTGK